MRNIRLTQIGIAALLLALIPGWSRAVARAAASGSDSCATCHHAEAINQPQTFMAHAMELPATNPILKAHPRLSLRRGEFSYTVTTQGAQSIYSVTDGTQTISLPILWGMGAGAQTWVLSRNGKLYESLVSYFPSLNGLGVTIGDETHTPHTLVEAMGRELAGQEVKSCLNCHSTGAAWDGKVPSDGKPDLGRFKPGVTCEHCHTGSDLHSADAANNNLNSIPASLGALSTEDLSNFCGQCHRSWSTVMLRREFGENNVRFSPYRLALSKCFNGADARIGCVACHNPHVNVSKDAVSYDSACLACHSPAGKTADRATSPAQPQAKICPVARSGCATCHMPKVKRADGHLTFTDHFIRIVQPGEPYPD